MNKPNERASHFSVKGFEFVTIIHNDDCRYCQIHWCESPKDGVSQKVQTVRLPAQLLVALVDNTAKDNLKYQITNFLETL